jgi:uncharacterized protein (TIGR01244 family)
VRKRWLFFGSVAVTMGVVLCYAYANRLRATQLTAIGESGSGVFVTSQLRPENFPFLRGRRIRVVVDLRPDGEAADEPSSQVMEGAARAEGLDFYYIPIPHEMIPDASVEALTKALQNREYSQAVLYCRTGRRAVRTFALAEASRPGGPSAGEILDMVVKAGFTADDLKTEIDRRIVARQTSATTKP